MDSTTPTTVAADMETQSEGRSLVYKGKATNRSWAQLPDEVIRLIGTFYLLNLAQTAYSPQTWEGYDHWPQRMIFTSLRDGYYLERSVMSVCATWHRALQYHSVYAQTVYVIDPLDSFQSARFVGPPKLIPPADRGGSAQRPVPRKLPSPWRHLRNILMVSCVVCKINSPNTPNAGLGAVSTAMKPRTVAYTPFLGMIAVCRDHFRDESRTNFNEDPHPVMFCNVCLRDNPKFDTASLSLFGLGPGGHFLDSHCAVNEDEETWPGVDVTCRTCRLEFLWKRACQHAPDREAIGGPPAPASPVKGKARAHLPVPDVIEMVSNIADPDAKNAFTAFVHTGDGTINDVLVLARERFWLHKHTRIGDMMEQARAARRWVSGGEQQQRARSEAPQRRLVDEEARLREELERKQLELDLAIAEQLEREREDGEYVETPGNVWRGRSRSVSPPAVTERNVPPHLQKGRPQQEQYHDLHQRQEVYEAPVTIQIESDATTYPASSPRTTTTATVISLDDAGLERIEDVEETTVTEQYDRRLSEMDDMDESVEDEYEEEEEEEEEEDDEEDPSVKSAVKDLALGDWARAKILDGFWISPADLWYGYDKVYKGSGMGFDQKYPEVEEEEEKGAEGGEGEKGKGPKVDRRKEGWTLAVHPCPWTIEKDAENEWSDATQRPTNQEEEEESHPRWETVVASHPPTFSLCEQAYRVHQKQIKNVLLPAMRNIVRKLVIECGVAEFPEDVAGRDGRPRPRTTSVGSDSSTSSASRKRKRAPGPGGKRKLRDPAMIATRMTMEEVVRIMREEEGVWFDGYDWMEKKRNEEDNAADIAAAAKRKEMVEPGDNATPSGESPPKKKRRKTLDGEGGPTPALATYRSAPASTSASTPSEGAGEEDSGTTSSRSGTSPVLSTTTLQTTPSPPPSNSTADGKGKGRDDDKQEEEEEEEEEEEDEVPRIRIPVAPVLESPRLLRPIPYIPLSVERFPDYTMQALNQVWREAIAPLFQCRCSICDRAARAVAAAANARRASNDAQRRYAHERQYTAPPPTTPRKDERDPEPKQYQVQQQRPQDNQYQEAQYRIPSIRLRPVPAVPKAELPRRQTEQGQDEEEGYVSGSVDGEEYERVGVEEYDDEEEDEVVEIDIQDVDLALESTTTTTAKGVDHEALVSPTFHAAGDGTPVTPTRGARKRSCDDTELEVDHAGRTVDVGVGKQVEERAPTPPKRQKMDAAAADTRS